MPPRTHIIIALVVALIVAGLFWNYTEAIKEKNAVERERIASEERVRAAELEQERSLQEAKEQAEIDRERDRQASLSGCLVAADNNYSANWASSCKTKSEAVEKSYRDCLSVPYAWATAAYCRTSHPAVSETDCTLTSGIAERWDDTLKEEKDACYQRYK